MLRGSCGSVLRISFASASEQTLNGRRVLGVSTLSSEWP